MYAYLVEYGKGVLALIKGLIWPPLEPKSESCFHQFPLIGFRERSGSVVECLTRDRGATG